MAFVDLAKSNAGARSKKTRSYGFALWLTGWPNKPAFVPQRVTLLAIISVALWALFQFGVLSEFIDWAHNETNNFLLNTITEIIGLGAFFWLVLTWVLGVDLNTRLRRIEEAIKSLWDPRSEVPREDSIEDGRPVLRSVNAGLHKLQSVDNLKKAEVPSISKLVRRAHEEEPLRINGAGFQQTACELERHDNAGIKLDDKSEDWRPVEGEEVQLPREVSPTAAAMPRQCRDAHRRAMESYDPTVLMEFLHSYPRGFESDQVRVRLRHLKSKAVVARALALEHAKNHRTCRRFDDEIINLGDDPPFSLVGERSVLMDRRLISVQWFSGTILMCLFGAAFMEGASLILISHIQQPTYFRSEPAAPLSSERERGPKPKDTLEKCAACSGAVVGD